MTPVSDTASLSGLSGAEPYNSAAVSVIGGAVYLCSKSMRHKIDK